MKIIIIKGAQGRRLAEPSAPAVLVALVCAWAQRDADRHGCLVQVRALSPDGPVVCEASPATAAPPGGDDERDRT